MSEYTVTFSEVPTSRSDDETHSGVLIYIRPPVQLNPDAVEHYLTFGDFEPLDPADLEAANNLDVKNAVLLGSTADQTTIYASFNKRSEGVAKLVANDMVKLLRFMGAQAIIDSSPTPDA